MNTLNKAFIKAFARDRSRAARLRSSDPATEPAGGPQLESSVELVLHDLFAEGDRLRIDDPPADETQVVPEAHLAFGVVQHVESYDPQDVASEWTESVIVEDRTASLAEQTEIAPAEGPPRTDEDVETIEIDSSDAEIDPADSGQPETREPEPEIETTWGYHVGDERPDIGEGASITFADEDAGDQTQVAVIALETGVPASDHSIRSLFGVEFGLPASTDLEQLKPGQFPVALPGSPADAPGDETLPPTAPPDASETNAETSPENPPADEDHNSSTDEASMNNWVASMTESEPPDSEPSELDQEELPAEEEGTAAEFQPWPQLEPMTPRADASATTGGKFGAAWEVDAFCWPEVCTQLDTAAHGQLRESGTEIAAAAKQGLKVLAVTSVHRDEGRTTLAMALARHAAAAGIRVALLDADAGNPELARHLGLESPCSWHDVASQGQALAEAAVYSLEDGVTLFPLTAPACSDLHTVDDRLLARTLHALSDQFDLVVVDLHPIEMRAPAMFGDCDRCPVDMAVVVRDTRSTDKHQIVKAVQRLRKAGVKAAGIAENYSS